MRPDWKDAPKWAKWLARDDDGTWFWYENEPSVNEILWMWDANQGNCETIGDDIHWMETKESRP